MKNSIEEDIKLLEELDWLYLDKPEIICDRYEEATNHILSDYKRALEENETLKKLLQGNLYEMYKYYRNLANSYQGNCISKEKVKNMIKEKEWALENYNCDESDYKQSQAIGACNVLQELLKESEEEYDKK